MTTARTIQVNRAPVLTLWAAVVARRLGFDWSEALSLGKSLAGLNAQAKGRRLGIFKRPTAAAREARRAKRGEEFFVVLLGRPIPARSTPEGVRAVVGARPVDPEPVERYLKSKFGDDVPRVRKAMESTARSLPPAKLADVAYSLYEQFRPAIPPGKRGWGAKGVLDLQRIRRTARRRTPVRKARS